jgi:hypothetical protein
MEKIREKLSYQGELLSKNVYVNKSRNGQCYLRILWKRATLSEGPAEKVVSTGMQLAA